MTKKHRTVHGDSFDSVAYRKWQDCGLVHRILQANAGFMDVLIFGAGIEIVIPEIERQKKTASLPPWFRTTGNEK